MVRKLFVAIPIVALAIGFNRMRIEELRAHERR